MLTPHEQKCLLGLINEVANRETDHAENRGISVDRDENDGISIVMDSGLLDLEPEEEDEHPVVHSTSGLFWPD